MLCYAFSYNIIGPLFNKNYDVIQVFKNTFWIIIIAQPFNSIAFTFDGIFKGMGKAIELRNTLIQATFLVFIPVLYLSNWIEEGLWGVWLSLSVWMVYRGTSLIYKFRKITLAE